MGFQAFFGLSWMLLGLSITPLLTSYFEHGHFTLIQTSETLKIGEALDSLSFGYKLVNSKYQTIASLISQLKLLVRKGPKYVDSSLECHHFRFFQALQEKWYCQLFST